MKYYIVTYEFFKKIADRINISPGPSNRSNSVSSLDLEGESVSELGAGPSGSNGVEALQLLEHEQGNVVENTSVQVAKNVRDFRKGSLFACCELINDH